MKEITDRIADPEHLLGAIRVSIQEGGNFLVSRMAPHGPMDAGAEFELRA